MSLATWKKEFYTPAARCAKRDALAHSLKKWEGLRQANLDKHGVVVFYGELVDRGNWYRDGLPIDYSTCALCVWFEEPEEEDFCKACPLAKVTGKARGGCNEQLGVWYDTGRPTKMINLIKKAIEAEGGAA